eukprot:5865455-Ditylum_brightwellii.AAC.1
MSFGPTVAYKNHQKRTETRVGVFLRDPLIPVKYETRVLASLVVKPTVRSRRKFSWEKREI